MMRALARDGMTMLIVMHEMRFAEDIADRLVVMDQGRIVDQGPSRELFRSSSHRPLLHRSRARDALAHPAVFNLFRPLFPSATRCTPFRPPYSALAFTVRYIWRRYIAPAFRRYILGSGSPRR